MFFPETGHTGFFLFQDTDIVSGSKLPSILRIEMGLEKIDYLHFLSF